MDELAPTKEELAYAQLEKSIEQDLEELSDIEKDWVTNPKNFTFKRYLVATKCNVSQAKENILATIKWRREYKPEEITCKDVFEEAIHGNIYFNGCCKKGRPIIYIKKRGTLQDPHKQLRLYFYTLEKAIAQMKNNVYQVIMIFDMEKMSRANSPPLSVSLETLRVLSNHFPERLGIAFFTYQPFIFSFFYNLIYPFLEDRQKEKLKFCGNANFSAISNEIDLEILEQKYGGRSTFEFSIDHLESIENEKTAISHHADTAD